jgi:hypothetical protein
MTNKLLAAGSVALVGAGSLLGATAAQAATAADCGTHTGATVSLINGTICEVLYGTPGDYSFDAPAGVSAFEAILIAGGTGSEKVTVTEVPSALTKYWGYSGEINWYSYEDVTGALAVTVGEGGTYEETLWTNSIPDTVIDGLDGEDSELGENVAAGSGVRLDDPIGAWDGVALSEENLVGANNPLFPVTGREPLYAPSGSIYETVGECPAPTFGAGGSVCGTTYEDGASGAVFIRWSLENLASTGVDASAIGIGAGGLLAGGVALGAIAAVRRARSTR